MNKAALQQNIDRQLAQIRRKKKIISAISSVFEVLSLSLLILAVFTFILGLAKVNQNSMLPNFKPGDIVVYNRLDHSIERGDVIVAREINDNILIIKRVIGLPGETVDISADGQLWINGEALDESWGQGVNILRDVSFPITLEEDEYFVMGDNREISLDSRSSRIGNIRKENIRGIVFFTIDFLH